MSRTEHHKNQKRQHAGEDLWSRRAGMGHYPRTTYGKRLTIRKERTAEKPIILRELDELE